MPKHHFSEATRAEIAASTAQLAVAADATKRARAVVDAISLSLGANTRAERPAVAVLPRREVAPLDVQFVEKAA